MESKLQQELLDRLRELDPETWVETDKHDRVYFRDSRMWWCAIQEVIQEAIAARGWSMIFEYPVEDSEWWGAEIKTNDCILGRIRIGPTAAEAILLAYVAALGA